VIRWCENWAGHRYAHTRGDAPGCSGHVWSGRATRVRRWPWRHREKTGRASGLPALPRLGAVWLGQGFPQDGGRPAPLGVEALIRHEIRSEATGLAADGYPRNGLMRAPCSPQDPWESPAFIGKLRSTRLYEPKGKDTPACNAGIAQVRKETLKRWRWGLNAQDETTDMGRV